MNHSDKSRVNAWIENVLYTTFDKCRQENRYPSDQEAARITPLLQMYQARQLENLTSAINSLESNVNAINNGYLDVRVQE